MYSIDYVTPRDMILITNIVQTCDKHVKKVGFRAHLQAIVQKALEPVRDWRQYRAWMARGGWSRLKVEVLNPWVSQWLIANNWATLAVARIWGCVRSVNIVLKCFGWLSTGFTTSQTQAGRCGWTGHWRSLECWSDPMHAARWELWIQKHVGHSRPWNGHCFIWVMNPELWACRRFSWLVVLAVFTTLAVRSMRKK